jgi:5-methylcytosine-specific restriction protein A
VPYAAKHPCSQPGCPTLVPRGQSKCEKHTKEVRRRYDEQRPNFRERGYSSAWDKASKSFRRRNPLCAECLKEGRTTPAQVTDHIKPHKGDPELFWDEEINWQSLCKSHHDRKTAREDGGGWQKKPA